MTPVAPRLRSTAPLWLLALALKFVGAAWDVSWHFRTIRESLALPHIVNTIGTVLAVGLFWYEWRRRTPQSDLPLKVIAAGAAVFFMAIPVDELWHRTFGLDLTTWSPPHLMLFYGTMVSIAGIALLFLRDLGWTGTAPPSLKGIRVRDALMVFAVLLLLLEAILFPLAYNEYATIAAGVAITAPETMDPGIVEMALTSPNPSFHNVHPWLYPVYAVGASVLIATLVHRASGGRPGWILGVFAGYAALRAAVDLVLGATGWPTAVEPWQYVAMGLAFEAAFLLPGAPAVRTGVAALLGTASAYAYWVYAQGRLDALPIGAESWPVAAFVALGAAILGWLAWNGAATLAARPEPVNVRRLPRDVLDAVTSWLR